jgi:hypothetical protein
MASGVLGHHYDDGMQNLLLQSLRGASMHHLVLTKTKSWCTYPAACAATSLE